MKEFAFPREVRLALASEFRRVREEGARYGGKAFLLGALCVAEPGVARFGIVTSRRLGNAVIRARARRRLREAIRHERSAFVDGAWIVLVARHGALEVPLPELRRELLRLAARAAILKNSP